MIESKKNQVCNFVAKIGILAYILSPLKKFVK